jgi:hypothetical protein
MANVKRGSYKVANSVPSNKLSEFLDEMIDFTEER